MKRVLIAGANSYIGRSVRAYLDRYPDRFETSAIKTRGLVPTPEMFRGWDVVLCTAGVAHIKETRGNRHLYYEVNRDLVTAIAKAAREAGVRQFILLSSMSVYGMITGHITKETVPHPNSAYGDSKLQADQLIGALRGEDFRFACLRPPMVYGKGCAGNYQTLRRFALRSPVFPKLENRRSMIYIDNLSEFILECIEEERSGLFFPQNEEYMNTSDLVLGIARENGKTIRLTRLFNPLLRCLPLRVVKKVFGSLTYERTDTVGRFSTAESIRLTEQNETPTSPHGGNKARSCGSRAGNEV